MWSLFLPHSPLLLLQMLNIASAEMRNPCSPREQLSFAQGHSGLPCLCQGPLEPTLRLFVSEGVTVVHNAEPSILS